MKKRLRYIEKKPDQSTNWALLADKHSVFIKGVIFPTILIFAFLIYTYDRSFKVHQSTVKWAHEYSSNNGAKFYYKRIHVGHDGTTLEAAPFPKEVGLAGTGTIDPAIVKEVGLAGTGTIDPVTAPSPLEQFVIHPPMNMGDDFYFSFTNPSLSMLLTLSLVLLLIFFFTKKGVGNVLSSSIHSVARNPSLAKQSFGYAILGFALTEAIASFAPMMAFLISSVFRSKKEDGSFIKQAPLFFQP
jgi:F-type H+-transporting ATPase subunit c